MSHDSQEWLDAAKVASEAMEIARNAAATQKAHVHVTMMMMATLAKSAPKEAVDQMIAELERVRDLSGPAGAMAGEVFATALSTLERFARRE